VLEVDFEDFRNLVWSEVYKAKRQHVFGSDIDIDDLFQEASMVFCWCRNCWDPVKGSNTKFSYYLVFSIRRWFHTVGQTSLAKTRRGSRRPYLLFLTGNIPNSPLKMIWTYKSRYLVLLVNFWRCCLALRMSLLIFTGEKRGRGRAGLLILSR